MLDRLVTQIEPKPEKPEEHEPRAFRDFLDCHNIVLLGDPGSGKTHLFEYVAQHEGAIYDTVRKFVLFEGENCADKTIYLDALDEFRSRKGDKDTIGEIVRIVRKLRRPRMRLSCRAADWLGNTDLTIFRRLAQDNGLVVLRLEPLTEPQILHIAQSRYSGNAQDFYREAQERGLDALIANPQTLIMLLDVVADRVWPTTTKELYERSVELLLAEPNEEHNRESLGQYEAPELFDAAGAASAALLLSGVAGLSLNVPDSDYPSYRHVPCDNLQKVQAALCRRAFVSVADKRVTYVHRTIAEFLAARWLAGKIRAGLPLGRVQSLICSEGEPAPELRGLHAWLATLLPDEHASVLISADPYGVLVYGDAASMPPGMRKTLLRAIQRLAQVDPWFRSGDWTDQPLGALSGPDMVEAFRSVLADPGSGLHLRSVVLDAIKGGPQVPELRDDLLGILVDTQCPYAEQSRALDALLHVIPGGVKDVVRVFHEHLVENRSTVRLRVHILNELYPDHLTIDDIVAVFEDVLHDPVELTTGRLWGLTNTILEPDLSEVLSALCTLSKNRDSHRRRRNESEVARAFILLVQRFLASPLQKQPKQTWTWLSTLKNFRGQTAGSSLKDAIKRWLQANPSFVLSMFDIAVEQASIDEIKGLFLRDFLGTILDGITHVTLAMHITDALEKKDQYSDKDFELYEFAIALCFGHEETAINLFERLYTLGDHTHELAIKRDLLRIYQLDDRHLEDAQRKLEDAQEERQRRERFQQDLYTIAELVQTGQHPPYLGRLAEIYFGLFIDSEKETDPVTRLRNEIGDDFTRLTLEGFQAVLSRHDLPSPKHIAELMATSRYYPPWYAILAGMDERWNQTRRLDAVPDAALEAALCLVFESTLEYEWHTTGRSITREWPKRILVERPELARQAFCEFLQPFFEKRASHINLLHELTTNESTQPWRSEVAMELLEKFPSAPPQPLRFLFYAALSVESCREKLAILAKKVLTARGRVRGEQRALWMVVGYLLSPLDFSARLESYLRDREWALWIIKELVERVASGKERGSVTLTIEQRRFLAWLIGRRFENAYHPLGETIRGDHHSWDAAEFVRRQIEVLSADASEEAGEALVALASDKRLASYRDHLLHAIANQAKIHRQRQYEQPDWDKTVETLRGGQPANIADLHALTIDHLRTLGVSIHHSNTDTYKQFWVTTPKHGKIEQPGHEEYCRDRLVDLLRPRLSPLDISAEPEGHMAADKRADIVLYYRGNLKLPIEVKKHTHKDLWTACENQLERLYARDPNASGFGIYLVLWFGDESGGKLPSPPSGIVRPNNARTLEEVLRSRIPEEKRYCLDVIVLDLTPLADTKAGQMKDR